MTNDPAYADGRATAKASSALVALKTTPTPEADKPVHSLGKNRVCDTESRGFPTPGNRSPADLVLHAPQGIIPLWASNVTLQWRLNEPALAAFVDPAALKTAVRNLVSAALLEWGDAAPVAFAENTEIWDFEIIVRPANQCSINGCTLARAFFPDAGRHDLTLFPILFEQTEREQVDTLAHEIGHIFGLRHFFAQVTETGFPSEIFGTHDKFTIMNYGELSTLTAADRADLKLLYQQVRSGVLTKVNGTPIRLVQPFHTLVPTSPLTATTPGTAVVPMAAVIA